MNLLPNSSIPTATFSLIRDHVLLRSPFFCLCVYRIYTTCLQEWIKSKIHRLLQSTVYMHAVCLTLKKDATCFSETSKRCQKTEKKYLPWNSAVTIFVIKLCDFAFGWFFCGQIQVIIYFDDVVPLLSINT